MNQRDSRDHSRTGRYLTGRLLSVVDDRSTWADERCYETGVHKAAAIALSGLNHVVAHTLRR